MEVLNSQEFWLALAIIVAGGGAVWALFRFGKALSERELEYWFHKMWLVRVDDSRSHAERQEALQDFSEIYRSYLRERNDFWDKYGQILVAIVIIVVLAVLLLARVISPESGLPILSGVGGYAIAKSSNLSTTNRPGGGPRQMG